MAFLVPVFTAAASAIGGLFSAGGAAAGAAGAGAAAAGSGFSLGTALSVGSTLLGAVGAVAQGQAASNAAKYNAQVQQQQAQMELDQAAVRATDAATRTRQRVAATRAGSLQNGFEADGSVADILNTVETQGTLEGLTALYDGSVRAQGLRASAELNRANARNSLTAGYLNAGTSLLSGFSRAYTGRA
ncbi:MAG: hypothetical protein ABFD65_13985 [Candidatus Polarisedimenticolia bacterium]